jgi:hypothetical protein
MGNLHYVDTVGTLRSGVNVKVSCIVLTTTGANGIAILADNQDSKPVLELRYPTSGQSTLFDFSRRPIVFPKGIEALTLTNCKIMITYVESGG